MSNSPQPLFLAGYSNLVGPSRNIGLVLDEAALRGIQTELIPHDADDPVKHLRIAEERASRRTDALLIAFSHPPPGQKFSPKEEAIVRSVPATTVVANVADVPGAEQFGRGNPMVGRTDMVFTSGDWYRENIGPEWGYRSDIKKHYLGPPPHLEGAMNAIRQGSNERTAGRIQTTTDGPLGPKTRMIYIQGDKDLKHIVTVMEGVRKAIEQLFDKTSSTIALVYRAHPGAESFCCRLNIPEEKVNRIKQRIDLLLRPERVTLDLTHLASDVPHDPYLFGAADLSLTTRGSTSSWVAALSREPTISVIQKGDIEDWFVSERDGTEVTDYQGLPATLARMLTPEGRGQLRDKQMKNFPECASSAGEYTAAARMIDAIVTEVRSRLG